MKTLGIIVLVIVVIALLIFGYRYFFKKPEDGTPCDSGSGSLDGFIVDGNCVKTDSVQPTGPNIDQTITQGEGLGIAVDKLVNSSDVSQASNPNFFQNINTSNMGSYNLIINDKKTKDNPAKIRFTSQFNKPYPQFVWYKNWLYSLYNKTSSGSGVDTYYYRVDKSSLPNQIKVITQGQCSVFKFKISGIEYTYSGTSTEPAPLGPLKTYCIYNKQ